MSGPVEKPYVPVPEDMLTEDLLALLSGTDRAKDLLARHGIREVQTSPTPGWPPRGSRRSEPAVSPAPWSSPVA